LVAVPLFHLEEVVRDPEQTNFRREAVVLLPREACPIHLRVEQCCLNQRSLYLLVEAVVGAHPLGTLVDSCLSQ